MPCRVFDLPRLDDERDGRAGVHRGMVCIEGWKFDGEMDGEGRGDASRRGPLGGAAWRRARESSEGVCMKQPQ